MLELNLRACLPLRLGLGGRQARDPERSVEGGLSGLAERTQQEGSLPTFSPQEAASTDVLAAYQAVVKDIPGRHKKLMTSATRRRMIRILRPLRFIIIVFETSEMIVGFVYGGDLGIDTLLRVARLGRILRVLKIKQGIRTLVRTPVLSVPSLANVGGLLFPLYFLFSLLGVELFGGVQRDGGLNQDAHFKDMPHAMLLRVHMSTGEASNSILADCMVQEPFCSEDFADCGIPTAPIFFVSFVLLGMSILLNLFIAITPDQRAPRFRCRAGSSRGQGTCRRSGASWRRWRGRRCSTCGASASPSGSCCCRTRGTSWLPPWSSRRTTTAMVRGIKLGVAEERLTAFQRQYSGASSRASPGRGSRRSRSTCGSLGGGAVDQDGLRAALDGPRGPRRPLPEDSQGAP